MESLITIGQNADNAGLTVWQPDSSNYIDQDGDNDMFRVVKDGSEPAEIPGVAFINIHITNTDYAEADILDNSAIGFGPGRTSPANAWRLNRDGGTAWLRGWRFINCEAWNLQGGGIQFRGRESGTIVRGFSSMKGRLAFDGINISDGLGAADEDNAGKESLVADCTLGWNGRHNYCVAGDGYQDVRFQNVYGEGAYRGGIDIEPGGDVYVDATLVNPGRAASGNIDAGLSVSSRSQGNVSGRVEVRNPCSIESGDGERIASL
ncbi:hypothetical protein [Halomicrobium urmianum]|uniref:hypothetical protein n=1 Tax=Halomicrobium urmianum TaxID=1586233 RepID=UPI001CD9E2E2|nr:hypothetical protein [Halomicrobium urmianum]